MNGNQIIFLSSTFKDMHAERDMIRSMVLPELVADFETAAVTFDFVDLRWGVDTADEQDERLAAEKILHVCFDEIERSKPFFICFLGDRYGWIPREELIRGACLNTGLSPEQFSGKSITEMEIEFALSQFDSLENCYFFFREGLDASAVENPELKKVYFATDEEEKEKVRFLKQRLREKYPKQVYTYTCRWDEEGQKVAGLEGLSKEIAQKVKTATLQQLPDKEAAQQDVYQRERQFQEKYFAATAAATVDRPGFTKPMLEFARQASAQRELALVAPSGLGKSSLAAWVADRLEKDGAYVLKLSAGLTANSLDFRFAVRYLYRCLCDDFGYTFQDGDYSAVKQNFYSLLSTVSEGRNVVVLLDALNQFDDSDAARKLDWINELFIPENVRILYTSVPEVYDQVFRKRDARYMVLDQLEDSEIAQIAQMAARRFHKQLPAGVLAALCEKKDEAGQVVCRSPLYLSMLMEYISDFDIDDFKEISRLEQTLGGAQAISQYIHGKIQAAPGDTGVLFEAISEKCAKHIGQEKTGFITAILAQSRFGLREKDICDVSQALGLTVTPADFSLYRKMFRLHLVQRNDGRWDFSHAILRTTLAKGAEKEALAGAILEKTARYFLDLEPADPLRQTELIYYLAACGMYDRLRLLFLQEGAAQVNALKETLCGKAAQTHLPRFFDNAAPKEEKAGCICACRGLMDAVQGIAMENARQEEQLLYLHLVDFLRQQALTEENLQLAVRAYFVYGALEEKRGGKKAALYFNLALGIAKKKVPYMLPGLYTDIFSIYQASGNRPKLRSTAGAFLRSIPRWKKLLPVRDKDLFLARAYYCKAQSLSGGLLTKPKTLEKWYRRARKVVPEDSQLGEELWFRQAQLQGGKDLVIPEHCGYERRAELLLLRGDGEYTTQPEKAMETYEEALQCVRNGLLHKENPSLLVLYQKVTERLCYVRAEQNLLNEETKALFRTAQSLCKKLSVITGEHSWNDRRAMLLSDQGKLFENDRREMESCDGYTEAVIKNGYQGYRPAFNKTAEKIVVFLVVALLAWTFLLIPVRFMLASGSWDYAAALQGSNVLNAFSDILQFFCSFLMALAVYQLQQNLSYPDKNTVSYAYGRKKGAQYLLIYCGSLLFSICYGAVRSGILFMSATRENAMALFAGLYYYVLNATLVFLIVWMVCAFVRRALSRQEEKSLHPAWQNVRSRLSYRHLCGFTLRCVLLMALVPVPLWIGMASGQQFESLTYNGTKLPFFWQYHWVPFVLEGLFCGVWLLKRKPKGRAFSYPAVPVAETIQKEQRKTAVRSVCALLVLCLCAAGLLVGGFGINAGRDHSQHLFEAGFYYELREEGAVVQGYKGEATAITIPDTLGGKPVTGIGLNAFREQTETLQEITFPDSLVTIEGAAFQGSKQLRQVNFGRNLVSIENYAFQNCVSLREIQLPDSVTTVQNNAFTGCTGLETVVLSGNLETLSYEVFMDCTALREIRLPASLKTFGYSAFENCTALTTVYLSEGLETIPSDAFLSSGISEITLPQSLQEINSYAFRYCKNLVSVVIPDSVTHLGGFVFSGCERLEAITWPKGVDVIPIEFFEGCTALKAFTVPDHITEIRERAFDGCTMDKLTLGKGVTVLEQPFGKSKIKTLIIQSSVEEVRLFADSGVETVILAEGVESIPEGMFRGCKELRELYLPQSLKSVGKEAFKNCENLESVYIPSLESWFEIVFDADTLYYWDTEVSNPLEYAENLVVNGEVVTDLVIPREITQIPDSAFYGWSANSITIHEGVTDIGENAFYGCTAEKLYLPDIYTYCQINFAGPGSTPCAGAQEVYFDGVKVGQELRLPKDLPKINAYAFAMFPDITVIVVPERNTVLHQDAFKDCYANYYYE